jgi:Uma2 family endonuclease
MARPLVRPEYYTYADYYAWPDVIRGELIDGQFHDMTPAPTPEHQTIAGNLFVQLGPFFRGKQCRPFIAPFDVRLPKPGDDEGMEKDVVQPDIVVVCDRAKIDKHGCRGAPDWIIEVLSPGTRKKDLTLKRDLYQRNRVPLYWIVSPEDRNFTVLRLDASGQYVSTVHDGQGRQPVAEYPGLVIDWDWVFEAD